MAVAEEGEREWKKENAKDKVTFKVVDVNSGNKIVWGPRSLGGDRWNNWKLRFDSDGSVKLNAPNVGKAYSDSDYQALKCQEKQIERGNQGTGMEVTVSAVEGNHAGTSQLKVEVNTDSCLDKGSDGKEECDIKLASGLNLRQENSIFL